MTSELEEIFNEMLDKSEPFKDCPLCEKGVLRYIPSSFFRAIVFRCSACHANLRWGQLTYEEKETVLNSMLRRWVKNLMDNLTDKQKKQLFEKWGSYA